MELFIFAPIVFILLVIYLIGRKKANWKEVEAARTELLDLKKRISETQKELDNMSINKSVQLSKVETRVLDQYELSNIRIPSDIIEDLHNMRFTDEKQALSYVEVQRTHWKHENSKKLFKGDM